MRIGAILFDHDLHHSQGDGKFRILIELPPPLILHEDFGSHILVEYFVVRTGFQATRREVQIKMVVLLNMLGAASWKFAPAAGRDPA